MKRTSAFVLLIIVGTHFTHLAVAQPPVVSSLLSNSVPVFSGIYWASSFMPMVRDGLVALFPAQEEPAFPLSMEWEKLKQKWSFDLFPDLPEKIDISSSDDTPETRLKPILTQSSKPDISLEPAQADRAGHASMAVVLNGLKDETKSESYWHLFEQDLDEDMDQTLLPLYMKINGISSTSIEGQSYYLWNSGGQVIYLTRKELYQMYLRWLRQIRQAAFERMLEWLECFGSNIRTVTGGEGRKKRGLKRPPPEKEEKQDEDSEVKRKKNEPDEDSPQQASTLPGTSKEKQDGATEEKKKNRALHFREKPLEKRAVIKRVEEKGGQKNDLTHFEARVGKFSRIMANALNNWGNVLIDLRNSGMAEPPQTGEELARAIRDRLKYSKESQYLARMIRYFQVMRLPADHEHSALLARYQRVLNDLLQYIAIHRNHWLLSEELIEQWLHFEDLEWLKIFADFPDRQEWVRVQPSTIEIPELLRHVGPGVTAELERYIMAIRGYLSSAEGEVETDPNAGIFYHYVPVSDQSYVVSLFFTMVLLADDSNMRGLLLGWMRAVDAHFQIETAFFRYACQDLGGLMLFTIPQNLREALLEMSQAHGALLPDPLLAGFDFMALDAKVVDALSTFSDDFNPHPAPQPEPEALPQPQPEQEPPEEMEHEQAEDS
ncbi:hypothetical protein [Endozoicomonas numazuensis]|uniref:Uncharacterized protein n=1 Tax=Endozoicomonas numazuensis TaxID=1137799 RepID=A0A081NEX4_9GAMM|nr:hypothetical protein [Endozoicomonas numazuensis]KEQ16997.1 hypothetical protein GZ78_20465 [Endozoicomonas numazuensis]